MCFQQLNAVTRSAKRVSSVKKKRPRRCTSAKQSAVQVGKKALSWICITKFGALFIASSFFFIAESVCSCSSGNICKFSDGCSVKAVHPSYNVFYYPGTSGAYEDGGLLTIVDGKPVVGKPAPAGDKPTPPAAPPTVPPTAPIPPPTTSAVVATATADSTADSTATAIGDGTVGTKSLLTVDASANAANNSIASSFAGETG